MRPRYGTTAGPAPTNATAAKPNAAHSPATIDTSNVTPSPAINTTVGISFNGPTPGDAGRRHPP